MLLTRWLDGDSVQVEAFCSSVVLGLLESDLGRSVGDSTRNEVCRIGVVEERIGSVVVVPLTRWFDGDSSQVEAAHRMVIPGSSDGGLRRSVSGSRRFEAAQLSVF